MTVTKSSLALKFLCFLLLAVGFTQAQVSPLTGRVLDPSHAPIVGARVEALAENAKTGPIVHTDETGTFSLNLAPGKYSLKVSKDGFAETSQPIEVSPSGTQQQDILLQVSSMRTNVTVTANAGYVVPVSSIATKTATPLRDVPQSITVVTQDGRVFDRAGKLDRLFKTAVSDFKLVV